MKRIIIAIDGPAASGKSTTAKLLAKQLGYIYIDTGAMYRACAVAAKRNGVNIHDEEALVSLLSTISIQIQFSEDGNVILLNGEDVTQQIREPDISNLASAISAKHVVREKMVELQRKLGLNGGAVLDGRDIGTVVFPDAAIKFFMVAPVEVRAMRRLSELHDKGSHTDYETVLQDLIYRDNADSSRSIAPLRAAEDAIEIDTGVLTIEEQVNLLYNITMERVGEQ